MDAFDPHALRRALSAHADGELDAADADRLRRHLAADPAAAAELARLQQLSADARRALRDRTPPPSDDLRQRLRQIAVSAPAAAKPAPRRAIWPAVARGLAAAVLLAVGIWVGRRTAVAPVAPGPSNVTPVADALPAAVVAHAEEIHGYCSRLAIGLHAGGYPADVAALAPDVEHDLHSDHPYPDLSSIGYRYRGAGPCGNPLADTAHLLYRSVRPGSANAVSVFVQPWHGQYPLDPGRLYTVSVPTSAFPMLAWRTDHVVYFLLADNSTDEHAALALIRGAPTTHP